MTPPMPPSRYWFPAKRYGWGCGPPSAWQGWVVLLVFVALQVVCCFVFAPSRSPLAFACCTALLVAVLTGICYLKGEPPKWRWGK